jgi:hypothetical protein
MREKPETNIKKKKKKKSKMDRRKTFRGGKCSTMEYLKNKT